MDRLTRTIHARVHNRAVEKVTRFFNATFNDIIAELYQNARRAGATLIRVTATESQVVIEDNGRGISDPALILSFGESRWHGRSHEDPAGMGMYALAQTGATIVSRHEDADSGWRCTLKPMHFTGAAPADVHPDTSLNEPGTRITIPQEFTGAAHVAAKAAVHLPVPVEINGDLVEQMSFLDAWKKPGYFPATPGWSVNC